MMRTAGSSQRALAYWRAIEVVGLALLAYVPFLVSSPGMVSGDSKQYLYLDPGRLLARAPFLWDPHVAAGTVPHQHIGYLFPMGPWYWVFEQLGVPDWVAQRLWLGTISLAAALGARWLFTLLGVRRAGALAGALVYMLSPYQLAFTARISVLLLPWAGLPWLVGLTMRAVRRGGWRDPALFALVVLVIGGVNASALLLVGIGPLLWALLEACRGRALARAAAVAAARIGVLTVGVSLWWAVGLRLQGGYGLPVLQLTENLRTLSTASSPDDSLRGIGNWFFYGRDRLGYSIDQADDYVTSPFVVFFSYAVPVVALLAAVVVRWRYRAHFAVLVIFGTVVGVGAWPYHDPSAYGELWRSFAEGSSLGLAVRNTPRVAPVIVLGLAGLVAAAVGSLTARPHQVVATAAVSAVVLAAFTPVWRTGYLSDNIKRPEDIPSYWHDVAAALDQGGESTRVLEIPGSNFAAYRWGNTVEPITPGLIDRPYLAREVLPYGSPESANLLDALDRRLQEATFEPTSLAPVARLFDVGTIALRSDLQYERFDTPRPRRLWAALTEPLAPGLEEPRRFGPPVDESAAPRELTLDEGELATPVDTPAPPAVALFDVEDPVPIVHTAPASQPVVLAGDGDGIVDAAAAGLLDGRALVLGLASLDDAQLSRAVSAEADLLLTDSNRRRAQNWFFALRDTKGATERSGQTAPDPEGYDFRLDPLAGATDASRTVVEHRGGRVDATGDGGTARPEDRPVGAFDGDPRTAWRVGGADPTGHRLVLRTDQPVHADQVTLVQPQDGPRDRALTEVRLRFDGGPPLTVDLGPESLTEEGQVVSFPARTFNRLEIELAATSDPPFDPALANAVGFAEVSLADLTVSETVRLPVDLARRVGGDASGHLDVVMSRLRYDPSERGRQDQELALDRRFELPDARSFQLGGTARVNPNAPDEVLDSVLGTEASGTTFSASGHLAGDLTSRASRAFDGDPATAWTASVGPQEGQWLDVSLPAPVTVDQADLTVVADGRHSVPTRLRLEADGEPVRTLSLPEIPHGLEDGATHQVTLSFEPVRARQLRLVVEEVRRQTPIEGDPDPAQTLPVAVVDAELAGLPTPSAPPEVPSACRDDLVRVDGQPVAVQVEGPASDARQGLVIEACDGPVELSGDSHRVESEPGLDTGIDVDRVVLASDGAGNPAPVAPRGAAPSSSGATVRVVGSGPTSLDLTVSTDGDPFWLVLGQSHSTGWEADASRGSVGPLQVVNGYANGWLVEPSGPGSLTMELRWTPQRLVWVGLGLSAMAVLACAGVLVVTSRRQRNQATLVSPAAGLADTPVLASPLAYPPGPAPTWAATTVVAGLVAIGAAVFSRPWIGLVAGIAVVGAAPHLRRARGLLTLSIPTALAMSRFTHTPELAWLALALLAADLACGGLRGRRRPR